MFSDSFNRKSEKITHFTWVWGNGGGVVVEEGDDWGVVQSTSITSSNVRRSLTKGELTEPTSRLSPTPLPPLEGPLESEWREWETTFSLATQCVVVLLVLRQLPSRWLRLPAPAERVQPRLLTMVGESRGCWQGRPSWWRWTSCGGEGASGTFGRPRRRPPTRPWRRCQTRWPTSSPPRPFPAIKSDCVIF